MVMTLKQAIEILELHNKCQRGAEIPQQSPELIGIAIDLVLTTLKNANNGKRNR
jgi:hypothetical protein